MSLVSFQYISIYRSNQLNLGLQNKIGDAEIEKGIFGKIKVKPALIILILFDNTYNISFQQDDISTISLAIALESVFLFELESVLGVMHIIILEERKAC